MEWESKEHPAPGTFCWVTDGESVWIARYYKWAANGWCNDDTWEDWDHDITHWIPLEIPAPPMRKS